MRSSTVWLSVLVPQGVLYHVSQARKKATYVSLPLAQRECKTVAAR
jgi:hypothetical protein